MVSAKDSARKSTWHLYGYAYAAKAAAASSRAVAVAHAVGHKTADKLVCAGKAAAIR